MDRGKRWRNGFKDEAFLVSMWGFPKMGFPKTMGFPTKKWSFWGVLRVPPFKETPMWISWQLTYPTYCWWQPEIQSTHQLRWVNSLSMFIPLFTSFIYPRWCRISSINIAFPATFQTGISFRKQVPMFHFRLVFFMCCGTTHTTTAALIHSMRTSQPAWPTISPSAHRPLQTLWPSALAGKPGPKSPSFGGCGWPLQIPTVLPQKKGRGIGFMPFLALGAGVGGGETWYLLPLLLDFVESPRIPTDSRL